ncbi:K(+)-transporting ATPase subunit F [Streptomyces sp. NPDC051561]
MNAGNIVGLLIAAGLIGYLLLARAYPEKF